MQCGENVDFDLQVGMHFKSEEVLKLYESAGFQTKLSSGFDLLCVEDIELSPYERFKLIDLGVVIKLPVHFHALLLPRSSMYKNWQIIQTNSVGLIDEDYCGLEDVWKLPVYYLGLEDRVIPTGTRICQFFIQQKQDFKIYDFIPELKSRGGHGSTGK